MGNAESEVQSPVPNEMKSLKVTHKNNAVDIYDDMSGDKSENSSKTINSSITTKSHEGHKENTREGGKLDEDVRGKKATKGDAELTRDVFADTTSDLISENVEFDPCPSFPNNPATEFEQGSTTDSNSSLEGKNIREINGWDADTSSELTEPMSTPDNCQTSPGNKNKYENKTNDCLNDTNEVTPMIKDTFPEKECHELGAEDARKISVEIRAEAQRKRSMIKQEEEKQEAMKAKKDNEFSLVISDLNSRLEKLGFTRSTSAPDFKPDNGDSCLMSLLDQMNRDDQDFKVWERDDFSFLRWYVTKQMEALVMKNPSQPFTAMIEGDPIEYIEKIAEDEVPLNEIFLNAAAMLFHKDIVLVPADGSEEIKVLYGGPGGTKGKGTPLYLGVTQPVHDIPSLFYSINPDDSSGKFSFILENMKTSVGNEKKAPEEVNDNQNVSPEIQQKNPKGRGWKRMDSYTGSASKDLEAAISEIVQDENMEELYTKLDKCEDYSDKTGMYMGNNETNIETHDNSVITYSCDYNQNSTYTENFETTNNQDISQNVESNEDHEDVYDSNIDFPDSNTDDHVEFNHSKTMNIINDSEDYQDEDYKNEIERSNNFENNQEVWVKNEIERSNDFENNLEGVKNEVNAYDKTNGYTNYKEKDLVSSYSPDLETKTACSDFETDLSSSDNKHNNSDTLKELNIRGIEQQESDIFFTQKGSVDAESQSNPESYLDAQTESQAGIQPEYTKPLNQTQRRRKIKITARSISTISQERVNELP